MQPGMLTFRLATVIMRTADCDGLILLYSSSWLCTEPGALYVNKAPELWQYVAA